MVRPLALALAAALFLLSPAALAAEPGGAAAYASGIIEMRSRLAAEFIRPGAEITDETFRQVCGAVGKRVKELSEKGYGVRHATLKERNPANRATAGEEALIRRFEADPALASLDEEVEMDGRRFSRHTRPIRVEAACLACHGQKDSRPAFIQARYPADRAYGYEAGELRGIISVLTPLEP